jgi:hypothetical protein
MIVKSAMIVRFYGEVAIVTGLSHDAGTNRDRSFDAQLRFTDVWVRRGSGRQLDMSQKTLVGTP